MKKFVGIGALIAAAAAVPYLIHKKRQKKLQAEDFNQIESLPLPEKNPWETDFKDEDHLIFCDESNLGKRLIQLENSINIRDIGGYTGLDGRKTKWRKVIRSEELAHLSDKDVEYFEELGLKHVFDFRDAPKAKALPDKLPSTADYKNIPVLKNIPFSHNEINFTAPDGIDQFMRKIYGYQVENAAPLYAEILKVMTDPGEYPILYHCTNGKDRTGFMTALILLICGVPEETIISDYSLTNLTFDEAFEILGTIMADEMNEAKGISKDQLKDFFGVKPEWLKIQLNYIKENYENVDAYLLDKTDLTKEDLDKIRENMLEAPSV
ncbi:tyrosine-protein phosphatase [Eubacterium limosum]|uniref:tyrosine-protein phosphatase n=1 Tax=Eubacterium limosum TaxID=1736 RepID=UPI003717F7BD